MPVVDSLETIIESKVVDANNGIDNLIKKLDIVSQKISAIGRNDAFKGFFTQAQAISKSMRSTEPQVQKVSKTLADIEKQYVNLGKGFTLKGSTEFIQKNIDSLTNQLKKATLAKERFETSGKTDLSGYERAVAKVIELKNQIDGLTNQMREISKTSTIADIKIVGVEEAKKSISSVTEEITKNTAALSGRRFNPDAMVAVFGESAREIENWGQIIERVGNNAVTKLHELEKPFNINTNGIDKAKESSNDFKAALDSLKYITPTINETNLDKLNNKLKSVEEHTEKLRYELEKGLRFGNISDKTFENLTIKIRESENQAEALRTKIAEVKNVVENLGKKEKATEGSTSSLGNSFNRLQSHSTNLSKTINSLGKSMNKTFSNMKSFTRQMLSAAGIMGGLYGAIRGAFKSIDIASDLTEVQNVVDVTFGDFKNKIESLSEVSIPQFGMSELTAKQIASRFQAMGTAMGFAQDKMADMSVDITKLAADMASFYNVEQEDVAKSLESIFTGTTRPLRQYGIDLTQATLAEWAMKNGLDANIQSMTQAEKAMLRYQYVMEHTTAAQGDFQRTSNNWANQIRILKQNFKELGGVIGGSLINAFKPFIRALNEAMTHIIAFAKTVSNALGKIFGWKYETGGGVATDLGDGAGYADDIAGGMDKAAKAGKKLRDYVLGIDEFNIIAPEEEEAGDGGGGAGAGGAGGGGYKDAVGAWEKTESMFESKIDSLFELGRYISDAISDALESINWDAVYEKARNFGSGLASFLNGLITPRLFYNLGETVANSINTAFHAANAFAITFDWKNLGNSLAKSVKGFFENWDAGLTAETFSNFAKGILQSMSSFLNTLSEDNTFEDMGQKLVDFLFGIDWAGLAWNTVEFFKALGNALIDFPSDFGNGIGEELVKKIFGEDTEYQMPDTFWEKLLTGGLSQTVAKELPKKIIDEMMGGIKGENDSESTINDLIKINETIEKIWKSAISGKLSVEDLAGIIYSKFSPDEWANIFDGIKTGFITKWGELKDWILNTGITGLMSETIMPWFTAEKWHEIGQGIIDGISLKWEEFKLWWSETALLTWWEEYVAPWFSLEKWYELANGIKDGIQGKWTETEAQWIINITAWWNKNVSPWFTLKRWTDLLSTVPEAFKNAFKNAANGAISMLNKIIEAAESMANSVISALNSIRVDIPDWVPGFGGKSFGINLPKVSIPRIPQFEIGGFPEDGLFFANHTELVGEFSNGKTAVANNAQIVEGISIGVESAVRSAVADILAPYLADIAQNTRETAEKDMSVVIGDEDIAEANRRGEARLGFNFTPSYA